MARTQTSCFSGQHKFAGQGASVLQPVRNELLRCANGFGELALITRSNNGFLQARMQRFVFHVATSTEVL